MKMMFWLFESKTFLLESAEEAVKKSRHDCELKSDTYPMFFMDPCIYYNLKTLEKSVDLS